MPVLNTADDLRIGSTQADKAYLGSTEVWSAVPAAPAAELIPMPGPLAQVNQQFGSSLHLFSTSTHQYAAWWEGTVLHPIAGKRTHGSSDWAASDLYDDGDDEIDATLTNDSHYGLAVGVDSTGHVHIVGNTHADPLRYDRTVNAGVMDGWTNPAMIGTEETQVTYPSFIRRHNGELLMIYRSGGSNDGDMLLNAFNTGTTTWSRRAQITDGGGAYNAYWNPVAVDQTTGRMHLFFTWRDNVLGATHFPGNEDVCYAYSDDGGTSWYESDGTAYTLPIVKATAEVVQAVAGSAHLLNACGACVDSAGNPHSVWKWDDANGTNYHHVWHDGTTWQTETVTSFTTFAPQSSPGHEILARPQIVGFDDGTLWVIGRNGSTFESGDGKPWMIDVTTPGSPGARTTLVDFDCGPAWAPIVDWNALYDRDELQMIVAYCDGGAATTDETAGYVAIAAPGDTLPLTVPAATFDPIETFTHTWWADGPQFRALGIADAGSVYRLPDERYRSSTLFPLLQTTSANRPTHDLVAPDLNDRAAIVPDGSNDRLEATRTIAQPITVAMVVDINTLGTDQRYLDGNATGTRCIIFKLSTDEWAFFAGATLSGGTATLGPHLILATFNGASSSLEVDGATVASGDAGSNSILGVRLGADAALTRFHNAGYGIAAVKSGTLTSGEKDDLLAWAQTTYGTP